MRTATSWMLFTCNDGNGAGGREIPHKGQSRRSQSRAESEYVLNIDIALSLQQVSAQHVNSQGALCLVLCGSSAPCLYEGPFYDTHRLWWGSQSGQHYPGFCWTMILISPLTRVRQVANTAELASNLSTCTFQVCFTWSNSSGCVHSQWQQDCNVLYSPRETLT